MSDQTHAALIARRADLKAIEAAGRAAEAERQALEVEIAKADALQLDPYMAETLRVIEQHGLVGVDAAAFMRGRMMAVAPTRSRRA
jgi:hypothetical protein